MFFGAVLRILGFEQDKWPTLTPAFDDNVHISKGISLVSTGLVKDCLSYGNRMNRSSSVLRKACRLDKYDEPERHLEREKEFWTPISGLAGLTSLTYNHNIDQAKKLIQKKTIEH
jgi:hypothetical protein